MVRVSVRMLVWVFGGLVAVAVLIAFPLRQPEVYVAHSPATLAGKTNSFGFFPPQTDDAGIPYVWSGPIASTVFPFAGKQPFDLLLTLRSSAVAGGVDAPVRVLVNGEEITQLRLDPRSPNFQTFRLPVARVAPGEVKIRLLSEPFRPKGDNRMLGTIVQNIAIDRQASWSGLADRRWLYGSLPFLGALAAGCVVLSRRTAFVAIPRAVALRAIAVTAALLGAVGMLGAVIILWQIGRLDAHRYWFWLFGSLYLAGFFAVLACSVPVMAADSRSLWAVAGDTALVRRWRALLIHAGSAALFALSTLFAFGLLASNGTGDVDDKLRWIRNIVAHGLVGGFQVSQDDYPPGTYVILWGITKIAPQIGVGSFLVYKFTLFAFLLLSSLAFFLWTRNVLLTIVMQLALTLGCMVMGYNDVYFIPLLLALWALREKKPVWFSVLFTVTCLMKWQPLILVPVLLIYAFVTMTDAVERRRDVLRLASAVVLPAAAILVATFAIFGPEFYFEFHRATSENFLSANALNFHWIVTQFLAWWDPQRFTFGPDTHRQFIRIPNPIHLTLIKLLFVAVYAWIIYRFMRRPKTFTTMLSYAFMGYLAYFLFNTSVHENHLVPAVILAGLLWASDRQYAPLFWITAVMTNLNMLLFYRLDGFPRLPVVVGHVDVTLVLATVNVALFIGFLIADSDIRFPQFDNELAPAATGSGELRREKNENQQGEAEERR